MLIYRGKIMKEKFSFTKDYTEIMKGVAILLMLFHHLFGFPSWYVEGVSYIGIPLRANTAEYVLGQFGHICVAIFAFLTGYGMFFSYKSGKLYKNSLKKIWSFLRSYWVILFGIFIPLNIAFGKVDITLPLILKNMVAHDCTLVPFAWYVRFYIEVMLTLPIFYKLMEKKPYITIPLLFVIPVVLNVYLSEVPATSYTVAVAVSLIMEYFIWLPCVLIGLCFAKYKLFGKIGELFSKLGKLELPICFVALCIVMYLRAYKEDTIGVIFSFDTVYVPAFVFLCCRIISVFPSVFKTTLSYLGNHSMNIWFLHSMFFFNMVELMRIAYAPRVSILIVGWVLLICLIISQPLKWIEGLSVRRIKQQKTLEKIKKI